MAKNIVVVSSTFRKHGNSEILADEFARGAEESGNKVKRINLRDIELNSAQAVWHVSNSESACKRIA